MGHISIYSHATPYDTQKRYSYIADGPHVSGTLHCRLSKSAIGQHKIYCFELLAFQKYRDLETRVGDHFIPSYLRNGAR